jgi:hypothetical protein
MRLELKAFTLGVGSLNPWTAEGWNGWCQIDCYMVDTLFQLYLFSS